MNKPAPAQNVLLIYNYTSRKLLRIVIPDFLYQEADQFFHSSANGEAMVKVPFWQYNSWKTDENDHAQHRAEKYIQMIAP